MFRLAKELGEPNPYKLARSIPAWLLWEWMRYSELEPFGERRDDYRIAHLMALIANIMRDTNKRSEPFTLKDFLIDFDGQDELTEEKAEELSKQKMLEMQQSMKEAFMVYELPVVDAQGKQVE